MRPRAWLPLFLRLNAVILLAAFASVIYAYRPSSSDWLWITAIAALGAAIGWYRGKMMQIHVDPTTHAVQFVVRN